MTLPLIVRADRMEGTAWQNFVSSAPTFLVNDVATTAQWYEHNLGFSASFFPKTPPYVYASLQRDGVEIMLLAPGRIPKAGDHQAGRRLGRLHPDEGLTGF